MRQLAVVMVTGYHKMKAESHHWITSASHFKEEYGNLRFVVTW